MIVMRINIITLGVLIFLVSCGNTSVKDRINEDESKVCDVLSLSDSVFKKLSSIDEISQFNTDKRLKLSKKQIKILFDSNLVNVGDIVYLHGVKKIHKEIFVLFLFVEGVSSETFYMMTVDCTAKRLDYIYLTECDLFDMISQNENSEIGLFITKYFHILNDTIISTRSIFKEEEKRIDDGIVFSSQTDSITYDYVIKRSGKIGLINADTLRFDFIK